MAAEPTFRYSAHVDRGQTNTSHALVLDLVGTGRRVLDVGCANGYLAEALAAQGNKVSGVESDADAAETARAHLDRLVIGDVEQLDLTEEFGAGSFDVVVFADVLEHVKDPAGVLARSRPLLAPGGFVVMSIPNVAHGAVRLALMKGRFDYRPVGLLDDTHLRFFTRERVDELLAETGFVAADARRTTAGLFETEIPLRREDFPADVVAEIEADPDSQVYQFVLRADPVDTAADGYEEDLAARTLELQRLRRALAAIGAAVGPGGQRPTVAVLDPATDGPSTDGPAPGRPHTGAVQALRAGVAEQELRRRLGGFDVRSYSLSSEPAVSELAGDVTASLAPWTPAAAGRLRAEVDAVVVLPGERSLEADTALADMEEAGVAVRDLAGGGPGGGPDPLVLAGRLADAAVLDHRRTYLAVTGLVPASGGYVVCLAPSAAGGELDRRVRNRPVVRPDGPLAPLDLLAVVAGADTVVTDSPALRALATGLGRPVVAGAADLDAFGAAPQPAQDAARRAVLASVADRAFDDLHAALLADAGSRLAAPVADRLAALERRVATLETVNAGLRQTLGRERLVMAAEVRRREGSPSPATGGWSAFNVERLQRELGSAHAHIAMLQAEIDSIYSTRSMRAMAPARRLYGRIRRLLPR